MPELMFRVEVAAAGEVRDKDGNLISSTPMSTTVDVTAAQLAEMGLTAPLHPEEK